MNPRIAEAMKAEAMRAIPERLDALEAKLDRILALLEAKEEAARTTKPTFAQPPARGR